jgi:divalent metal cation (Fe/Co/Zn/Cd) transporter
MSTADDPTVLEMIRADPVRGGLFVSIPILVAAVQLLNSVVNDLSFLVSVPVAAVMVAFSVLLVSYRLSRFRLDRMEDAARDWE